MYKIKEARKAAALTQKHIAELLNVTTATYSRYENGLIQPDPITLLKISNILNVSVDYLLGREEKPSENLTEIDKEIIKTFGQLDEKQKQQAIEFAKFLLSRDGNATDKK